MDKDKLIAKIKEITQSLEEKRAEESDVVSGYMNGQISILNQLLNLVENGKFEKDFTITRKSMNWLKSLQSECVTIMKPDKNSNIQMAGYEIYYTVHLLNTLEFGKDYQVSNLLKMKVEG